MPERNGELYIALAVSVLIGVFYLAVAQNGVPGSSDLLGHGLGIMGFVLMLGAETLYSWRKQIRGPGRGPMSSWLQVHVFIGLMGPFLVLLHSAWQLDGLAGVLMLVTMLMVASGFLCRYVYTAVPRTIDGAEMALRDVELEISEAEAQLQGWKADHPAAVAFLGERLATVTEPSAVVRSNALTVLGGTIQRWGYQWQVRRELQELGSTGGGQARELRQLLERRNQLESQARSLASARRLLGLSRTIHVTLGIVLFTLAFVHIGMALYFATFAH